jgi:flagellar basal body rod protein FlgG
MSDGIYAALSGAVAQERALEVVANNVANVGTAGFRADRLTFAESLSRATGPAAVPASLHYVVADRQIVDPTAGPLRETGNPLDLALSEDGVYFAVRTPRGERYTRDGSFSVAPDGIVRTRSGDPVLAEASVGASPDVLRVPPGTTTISVGPDGTLSAGDASLGRARIVRLPAAALRHEGGSLLVAAGAAPVPVQDVTVASGWLEGANVSPIAGMNELVAVTRSFEAFQRVIQGFRDLDTRTARELAGS